MLEMSLYQRPTKSRIKVAERELQIPWIRDEQGSPIKIRPDLYVKGSRGSWYTAPLEVITRYGEKYGMQYLEKHKYEIVGDLVNEFSRIWRLSRPQSRFIAWQTWNNHQLKQKLRKRVKRCSCSDKDYSSYGQKRRRSSKSYGYRSYSW